MRFWAYLLGTFFYSGRSPFAPGTAGSLLATLLLIPFAYLLSAFHFALVEVVGILLFISVGIPAATYIEKAEKKEDPGCVVIDEAAGQWITFLFLPMAVLVKHPWLFVLGFLLFRLFDILKPSPVRNLEQLPRGYGIMFDDVAAGLYACLTLNLIAKLTVL